MKNTQVMYGIVVKSEKVGEFDARIKILCPDGLKSFTATGVHKPNAKLKPAIQLFTIGEFNIIGHKITGAHVIHSNHEITRDIKKYYLACSICEVITQLHGSGFALTAEALNELCNTESEPKKVYAEYFTALLHEMGYDIQENQTINHAYAQNLDIKIPNTTFYLT